MRKNNKTENDLLTRCQNCLANYPLRRDLRGSKGSRYWLGYSGGRDSHVLLDVLCRLRDRGALSSTTNAPLVLPLTAIHVNHRFSAQSDDWAAHCQGIADAYGVPLVIETLAAPCPVGDSLEAFAREARYRLIARHLGSGDIFLSGHHQRDQAETFLLQLMRGAGLHGLRGMPVVKAFGAGRYLRPLLDVPYADIVAYAAARDLHFIDDGSNADTRFDRNYLRHEVLPVLEKRFAHAQRAIATSAAWLAELPEITPVQRLAVHSLQSLSIPEQKQQLRAFVKAKTGVPLSQRQTQYVLQHHLSASADKQPTLVLDRESEADKADGVDGSSHFVVRRFAGEIVVTAQLPHFALDERALDKVMREAWGDGTGATTVTFGENKVLLPLGELNWRAGQGGIILPQGTVLTVRRLHGGDRFHPERRQHSATIKKLLHEAGIPPWLRPLYFGLYLGDELLVIPGVGVAKKNVVKTADARLPLWQIAAKFVRL